MSKTVNGRLVISKTGRPVKPNKYGAVKTTVYGITFESGHEANRYLILRDMLRAGEIKDLRRQVDYRIDINGEHICIYRADFVYVDTITGQEVVEDAKGVRTPVYRLKRKLMRAVLDIEIQEV
jgi:hypothetical protein